MATAKLSAVATAIGRLAPILWGPERDEISALSLRAPAPISARGLHKQSGAT